MREEAGLQGVEREVHAQQAQEIVGEFAQGGMTPERLAQLNAEVARVVAQAIFGNPDAEKVTLTPGLIESYYQAVALNNGHTPNRNSPVMQALAADITKKLFGTNNNPPKIIYGKAPSKGN